MLSSALLPPLQISFVCVTSLSSSLPLPLVSGPLFTITPPFLQVASAPVGVTVVNVGGLAPTAPVHTSCEPVTSSGSSLPFPFLSVPTSSFTPPFGQVASAGTVDELIKVAPPPPVELSLPPQATSANPSPNQSVFVGFKVSPNRANRHALRRLRPTRSRPSYG